MLLIRIMGWPTFTGTDPEADPHMPWAMVMATGAVEPTEENLKAWAASGVTAVGMGSKLFPKEKLAAGDWQGIAGLCTKCLDWFSR